MKLNLTFVTVNVVAFPLYYLMFLAVSLSEMIPGDKALAYLEFYGLAIIPNVLLFIILSLIEKVNKKQNLLLFALFCILLFLFIFGMVITRLVIELR